MTPEQRQEALRLALTALTCPRDDESHYCPRCDCTVDRNSVARAAIRAALDAPQPEPVALEMRLVEIAKMLPEPQTLGWETGDMCEPDTAIKGYTKRQVLAVLAEHWDASPPAREPLTDEHALNAARYRWLRGGKARTTGLPKAGRIEVAQWEDRSEGSILKGDALDAAIDAAMQEKP